MNEAALQFWTGTGGNDYIDRNGIDAVNLRRRSELWNAVFDHIVHPHSVLEVGANIGANIAALRALLPPVVLDAVEPNRKAFDVLNRSGVADDLWNTSADNLSDITSGCYDVALTCGVLIHIEPERLLESCKEIHRVSRRYIVCAEYFSDQPVRIDYRGNYIWKRDWGQFYLDNFKDLRPIACGFAWRGLTGLDNLTWWVLEKC